MLVRDVHALAFDVVPRPSFWKSLLFGLVLGLEFDFFKEIEELVFARLLQKTRGAAAAGQTLVAEALKFKVDGGLAQ